MTSQPSPDSDADTNDNTGARPAEDRPPSTPRWVKLFAIVGVAVVLLIVIILIAGLGGPGAHGPSRHVPSGDAGGGTPAVERLAQRL